MAPDTPPRDGPPRAGEAGASARIEYERRHARREQRIEERWGPLGGLAKFLSDDPQSTKAWAKGSDGEKRLARRLLSGLGDRVVLLHDRALPGTHRNIDHLVVAASGVWVIDAKNYKGLVEQRDLGGWRRADQRLYVKGRDRSALARGLGWQVETVARALPGEVVPINAALCFIEAEWRLFSKTFEQDGVWVTWGSKLVEMIAAPGPIGPNEVRGIAERLAVALPPASQGRVR